MFLCWVARINYIGTPQGSEILVRPYRSKIYKFFAIKSLLAADHIIVDSSNLQNTILKLCGRNSTVIQNGIDVSSISQHIKNSNIRKNIVSFRGLYPNYRIEEIFKARNHCRKRIPLILFYPFWEDGYKEIILKNLEQGDLNLGRIPTKAEMYKLLSSSLLAISIPASDSSPRSVYEAIFCGCCVAVTYNTWIDSLPACMKSRLFIVDLEDNDWIDKAIEYANLITKTPYKPSEIALDMFDERRTMKTVADLFYK